MTNEASMNDVQELIAIAPPEDRKIFKQSKKRPQSYIEVDHTAKHSQPGKHLDVLFSTGNEFEAVGCLRFFLLYI